MDLGIAGRTALVLGGAGGLGRAICAALGREGAHVAVADINESGVGETVADVISAGSRALPFQWDLADLSVIDRNIDEIERRLGAVDILVSITGGPPPTPAAGQDRALWRKQFEAMVLSVVAVTDRVLPGMRERRWGRIVTSTSSGVIAPIPNLGISNALRLSLVGWSKTLAREVAADGVTANVIVPGRIATARIRQLDDAKAAREGRAVEAVMDESIRSIPLQRYGQPEEYADVACFLASERASYVTGSVVRVDGGLVPSI
jgi:3-oxoacyl-[acyl-carrier protein] reductase